MARRLPVRARRTDLRGHKRDPAQRRGGARAAAAQGGVMRFGFTSDQHELAGAVREILAAELAPEARAQAAEASGRRGAVWKSLAEAGVFGLLVPEDAGGLGLTELDAVLVLEELGRAAVPGPVAETAFVAAPLIAKESA